MKAFPSFAKLPIGNNEYVDAPIMGMDLRDYFAAKAMQGLIEALGHATSVVSYTHITEMAYKMADAMMKAREK